MFAAQNVILTRSILQDTAEYNLARLRERRIAAESAKTVIQSDLETAAESRVHSEQRAVAKQRAANTSRIVAVRVDAVYLLPMFSARQLHYSFWCCRRRLRS